MSAGKRDTLVTFQRANPTTDEYNEPVGEWDAPTALGQEWTEVFYGSGSERRQAAMEQGRQAATFRALSNGTTEAVTLADRISAPSGIWNIAGIKPDTPRRGWIEFDTTRTQ